MKSWHLCALWLCLTALELAPALKFHHVTKEVGLRGAAGQISAYADFNADKTTDVLILSQNNSTKSHSIYLWSSSDHKFRQNEITLDVSSHVAEVSVADFDGDGTVDILTLSAESGNDKEGCFTAAVHWCAVSHENIVVDDSNHTTIARNVKPHPLVVDSDGDHIPDVLLVSCEDDLPRIWSCQGESRDFTETLLGTAHVTISSSHYVDINSDCLADIIFVGKYNGVNSLEVWLKDPHSREFVYHQTKALPSPLKEAAIVGELAFADMDGDAVLEAIVFSCMDKSCDQSYVHILYQQKFHGTNVYHCKSSSSWKMNFTNNHVVSVNLAPGKLSPQGIENHTPIIGDVNLDGHPDVIAMATNNQEGDASPQPLLLLSAHCKSHCNGSTVTLHPRWDTFDHLTHVTSASFFDLEEDGVLDVLVAQQTAGGSELLAYQQSLSEDHAFLKVLVVSGHCFSSCPSGRKPYGSVLPGAVVAFSTTDRNGKIKKSVAVTHQGSTLQLPFIVFGLGETPNFIETLTVGAAHSRGASHHQWTSLIPNSQIIVITRPPNDAGKWQLELYLTPSHLIYNTAGVLCALFVGVAILVALLHTREKYIDSRERKQAKHKFHFNAM